MEAESDQNSNVEPTENGEGVNEEPYTPVAIQEAQQGKPVEFGVELTDMTADRDEGPAPAF